jgi:hypothetical protein
MVVAKSFWRPVGERRMWSHAIGPPRHAARTARASASNEKAVSFKHSSLWRPLKAVCSASLRPSSSSRRHADFGAFVENARHRKTAEPAAVHECVGHEIQRAALRNGSAKAAASREPDCGRRALLPVDLPGGH